MLARSGTKRLFHIIFALKRFKIALKCKHGIRKAELKCTCIIKSWKFGTVLDTQPYTLSSPYAGNKIYSPAHFGGTSIDSHRVEHAFMTVCSENEMI